MAQIKTISTRNAKSTSSKSTIIWRLVGFFWFGGLVLSMNFFLSSREESITPSSLSSSLRYFLSTPAINKFEHTGSTISSFREVYDIRMQNTSNRHALQGLMDKSGKSHVDVFVNYVFSESGPRKDSVTNLRFFLEHGVTTPSINSRIRVDYGIVVNGKCTHSECKYPHRFLTRSDEGNCPRIKILLHRDNSGFDFGAHAAMLEWLDQQQQQPSENDSSPTTTKDYDAFIFLNDGVVGPILPSYLPTSTSITTTTDDWHWTRAFLDRFKTKEQNDFRGEVGLVGTSIVCLPPKDLGGYGPKVEGFTFGITNHALQIVRQKGTSFAQHLTKVDAILKGEYNLTKVLLAHDINIDCLLKAYQNIDWRDKRYWNCNNLQHPTRKGKYFGSSINPLEVMFHKPHWAGMPPVNLDDLKLYTKFQDASMRRIPKFSSAASSNNNKYKKCPDPIVETIQK